MSSSPERSGTGAHDVAGAFSSEAEFVRYRAIEDHAPGAAVEDEAERARRPEGHGQENEATEGLEGQGGAAVFACEHQGPRLRLGARRPGETAGPDGDRRHDGRSSPESLHRKRAALASRPRPTVP